MALISRRNALAVGAASLALPSFASAAGKRALRVVHLTDFHCQPELHAAEEARWRYATRWRSGPTSP